VILLDRSRSMDQSYMFDSGAQRVSRFTRGEPKASVARRLLAQFAARRTGDRFALVAFSTQPIPILGLTRKPELIAAALAQAICVSAGRHRYRRGILGAIRTFDRQPYRGSRVIMLASDGGGHIDEELQREIAARLKQARITLYWLYIRSFGAPSLLAESSLLATDTADVVAEQSLHPVFFDHGQPLPRVPGRQPNALQEAIDQVGSLENAPLEYARGAAAAVSSNCCFLVRSGGSAAAGSRATLGACRMNWRRADRMDGAGALGVCAVVDGWRWFEAARTNRASWTARSPTASWPTRRERCSRRPTPCLRAAMMNRRSISTSAAGGRRPIGTRRALATRQHSSASRRLRSRRDAAKRVRRLITPTELAKTVLPRRAARRAWRLGCPL